MTQSIYVPGSIRTQPKARRSAEEIKIVETDPVLPFTGRDHSAESMQSALDFHMGHDFPEWHKEARCVGMAQELFFGNETDETSSKRHRPMLTMSEVKRAKAICDRCPVRKQCLEFALVNHEEFGVWGGTTQRDRAKWWKANDAVWAERDAMDE